MGIVSFVTNRCLSNLVNQGQCLRGKVSSVGLLVIDSLRNEAPKGLSWLRNQFFVRPTKEEIAIKGACKLTAAVAVAAQQSLLPSIEVLLAVVAPVSLVASYGVGLGFAVYFSRRSKKQRSQEEMSPNNVYQLENIEEEYRDFLSPEQPAPKPDMRFRYLMCLSSVLGTCCFLYSLFR